MAANITTNTAVICRDGKGHTVSGVVVDVMPGECRGGGLVAVQALWPAGPMRLTVQFVEMADVEVAA